MSDPFELGGSWADCAPPTPPAPISISPHRTYKIRIFPLENGRYLMEIGEHRHMVIISNISFLAGRPEVIRDWCGKEYNLPRIGQEINLTLRLEE